MRCGGIGIALVAVGILYGVAHAQHQPPNSTLSIQTAHASTWTDAETQVLQLTGPVQISTDRSQMRADRAVIWLTQQSDLATIALIGDAELKESQVKRAGPRLLVTANVHGSIRLSANDQVARDESDSSLYREAMALREESAQPPRLAILQDPPPSTDPTTQPTTQSRPRRFSPVLVSGTFQGITTRDNKLAIVFTNGVTFSRQESNGENLELHAARAVAFTTLSRLRDADKLANITAIQDAITAAYLEGDVRISQSHADIMLPEQRLEAERVYYEFTTNRAVLTDAVIHTMDPKATMPIIVRAQTVKQLADGEFRVSKAELTTSSFIIPSYSLRADKAYIRQYESGNPAVGTVSQFSSRDVTLRAFGIPFFWLPAIGGEFTERGIPLRNLQFSNNNRFGFGVRSEWGLLEALGIVPPPDLDAALSLDYFTDRGPAAGIDVEYGGGFITQTSKQAWNFQGKLQTYFVFDDQGVDDFGRRRIDIPPEETFRGRIRWEHQQFLPNDWQIQIRSGWVSDPNFLEQWFEPEFNDGPPLETAFYAKKQHDSEALTLLVSLQPNHIVTTADMYQETNGPPLGGPGLLAFEPSPLNSPFEIERLPEIGYHRIGEDFGSEKITFFSNNTFSGLTMVDGKATLAEMGFRSPNARLERQAVLPGIPALGTTGFTDDTIYRGDFREEVDYPFGAGQFRFLPYVFGRYTGYSDSPADGQLNRFYVGTGIRVNTSFWKIDNSAESELLDIHRVRHIIEPELHLFTSAATADRSDPFIFDQEVDAINDVSAASMGLRQRWQTKRGGPGNERSVDFFSLNVNATFYANAPPEPVMPPSDFRGLFFHSLPEASIPRDSVNGEAMWRVTDSTAIIADASWNIEAENLATAGVGLAARRGDRMSYFVGTRYIEELSSAITTLAIQYQLSTKYSLIARWSFDFGDEEEVFTSISVQRKFDRFYMLLSFYRDEIDDESGFSFSLYPEGFGQGISSSGFAGVFGR